MRKNSLYMVFIIFIIIFSMLLLGCNFPREFTYYTVTFNSMGGTSVENARVMKGNPIPRPDLPTRDNYSSIGWYKSIEITPSNLWNFDRDRVTRDITLYAGWQAIQVDKVSNTLSYELINSTYTVTGVGDETAIIIPSNYNSIPVTSIGESAFAGKQIISIVIPDTVTSIGLNAFNNCAYLSSVSIGEDSSLTTIENNAFSGNSSLKSIYIPSKTINLGDSVFNNCGALDSITVSTKNSAFYSTGNNLIETRTQKLIRGSNSSFIPEGVIILAKASFRRSTISSITIPSSVTRIENYVFDDCNNLCEINVSSGNLNFSSLDGILYNKTLTSLIEAPVGIKGEISLPTTLAEIPNFAFDGRTSITSIFIPNGDLTRIRNFAFRNTTTLIKYAGSGSSWNNITKAYTWGGASLNILFNQIEPQKENS